VFKNSVQSTRPGKSLRRICAVFCITLPFVAGLCFSSAKAAVITVTISGTAAGTLNGNTFDAQAFDWILTYDTTNTYSGPLDPGQSLFLNPVSEISLHDTHPDLFHITAEQGLFFDGSTNLYVAPVLLSSGNPTSNILTIQGNPAWNGLSGPYQSTSITSANFSQFVGISSDLGLLTMDDISNAVTSVSTGVPEPSIMAILLATGAGWTCVAFCRKRRFL
jgi:hypothetical protein